MFVEREVRERLRIRRGCCGERCRRERGRFQRDPFEIVFKREFRERENTKEKEKANKKKERKMETHPITRNVDFTWQVNTSGKSSSAEDHGKNSLLESVFDDFALIWC